MRVLHGRRRAPRPGAAARARRRGPRRPASSRAARTGRAAIEAAGCECWIGDPDRIGTLRYALENVTILMWLLGTATGADAERVAALHGSRLQMMLEKTTDTDGARRRLRERRHRGGRRAGGRRRRDPPRRLGPTRSRTRCSRPTRPMTSAWVAAAHEAIDALLAVEPEGLTPGWDAPRELRLADAPRLLGERVGLGDRRARVAQGARALLLSLSKADSTKKTRDEQQCRSRPSTAASAASLVAVLGGARLRGWRGARLRGLDVALRGDSLRRSALRRRQVARVGDRRAGVVRDADHVDPVLGPQPSSSGGRRSSRSPSIRAVAPQMRSSPTT